MLQTRRFSLSLTDAQLDALRSATDVALNVPAAEECGWVQSAK